MKKQPITLSLPEHLIRDLHLYIPQRKISGFIANLVEKGLEDKKELLAREFREASEDDERNSELELWDKLVGDGLDESNDY